MDRFTIGIDLGGTNVKAAIVNEHHEIIVEKKVPTEAVQGPSHVLRRIHETIEDMLRVSNMDVDDIACMGIGVPGLLDPNEGLSIFSPNFPGWENVHVVREMGAYYDFPIFIDNDVRVNLYGEWQFGAGKGHKNLMLITLGTGLGSGILHDGKVLYGHTSSAGEIGHMNMYREGRPCRCGSSGCLGRYASAVGMIRTFTEKLQAGHRSIVQEWTNDDPERITGKMISDAYDLGDQLAMDTMHETGRILGFGLSNVINLLNPELIIVGGGMAAAGDRLLRTVRETTAQHALKLSNGVCKIETAVLGNRAGVIGAAYYANHRL